MNDVILSIAIPTYNRASWLQLCLSHFFPQVILARNTVEVTVYDNASSDNTSEVVNSFLEQGFPLRYVRNVENIGPDRNFSQCYDLAKSPYVWVFGDDDVILPNCLSKVLEILIKKDVDILYINNYWFKDNYEERLGKQNNFGISKFKDPLGFARRTNVMLTFISALIVRTGVGFELRSALLSSNLVQFSWVLPLLRDGKCFVILNDKLVAAKGGNSSGYGLVNVFGRNLKKITDNVLIVKPRVAKAIQNGTIVKFFPGLIMAFRKGKSQFADQDMTVGLLEAYGNNWRYYIFIAPLINTPLFLSRFYYYFVRVLAKLFGRFLI